MATVTCPDGHESTTTDWCDTCGIAMAGAGQASGAASSPSAPSAAPSTVPAGECPNCGTEHLEGELFCEVCGLDFATGDLPDVAAAPAVPTPTAAEVESGEEGAAAQAWSVTVDADRAWFEHNEAESGAVVDFPADARPRTVALVGDVVSIGRRDDKRAWYPGIDLAVPVLDPSSSRKHAELRRTGDGWQVVDLDSTNGTTVDGNRIVAGSPTDVADGTVIHLGAFTRLVVHAPQETT